MDILHRISVDLLGKCSGNTFCHYAKGFQRGFASVIVSRHLAPKPFEELFCRPLLGCLVNRNGPRLLCLNSNRKSYSHLSISCVRDFSSNLDARLSPNNQMNLPQDIADLVQNMPLNITQALSCVDVSQVQNIADYYFGLGGKRIRPTTVFLMAAALNPHKSPVITCEQHKIGVICEMIHTASLVHDDVIDEATTRRSQPALNILYGNKHAILIGDFILAKATQLLCSIGKSEVIRLLAQVIEDLVKGEFMQLDAKTTVDKRLTHYMNKTFKKTASLFAHSCQAVALLDGAGSGLETAAYDYGRHVGLAFQIADDILDLVAQSSTLGKPAAADLSLGLATAPVIFASQQYPELEPMICRRFNACGDVQRACELVMNSDGIAKAKQLAQQHVDLALNATQLIPPSKYRDSLQNIAHMQINRNM